MARFVRPLYSWAIALGLLAAGLLPAGLLASGNTVSWDGKNGIVASDDGYAPGTVVCGTAWGAPVDGAYLMWVLTTSKASTAEIRFGVAAPVAMSPSNVKGTFKYVQREPGSIADLRSAGVVASYSGGKDSKVRLVVGMGCLNPPACAGVMCFPLQAGVVGSYTPSGAGIAWPPGASGTFAGATTENWGDGFEGDPTNGYLLFQRNFGHSADDSRNAVGGTYPSVTLNAGATPFVVGSLSFLTGYNASTCITQSGYTVAVQVSTDLVTWTAFGSSFAATQGTVTVTGTPVTVTANGHAYFRWVPSGLGCSYENTGTDYFMLDDIVFSAPSP